MARKTLMPEENGHETNNARPVIANLENGFQGQ
jgi:hypothetical protein